MKPYQPTRCPTTPVTSVSLVKVIMAPTLVAMRTNVSAILATNIKMDIVQSCGAYLTATVHSVLQTLNVQMEIASARLTWKLIQRVKAAKKYPQTRHTVIYHLTAGQSLPTGLTPFAMAPSALVNLVIVKLSVEVKVAVSLVAILTTNVAGNGQILNVRP